MKITQKPLLRGEVITRWRKHLLDREAPRLNMDYPVLEHEGKEGDPKRFEGDPGFILAYFTQIEGVDNDSQLSAWMADKQTEYLIHTWTGIPIEDAHALVNPRRLWEDDINYPTSTITARQFVSVLDVYLETGYVLWEKIIMDNPKFKVAPEDLPALESHDKTPSLAEVME